MKTDKPKAKPKTKEAEVYENKKPPKANKEEEPKNEVKNLDKEKSKEIEKEKDKSKTKVTMKEKEQDKGKNNDKGKGTNKEKEKAKEPVKPQEKDKFDISSNDHTAHIQQALDPVIEEKNDITDPAENPNLILIEKKPREEYLQEKIQGMKINPRIVKGVTSSLDFSMENIKLDIKKKAIQFTDISKSVNDILINTSLKRPSNVDSRKFHLIKNLKKNEAMLQNNLFSLTQNQHALEEESFNKIPAHLLHENNIRKAQLRDIKIQKEDMISRIEGINTQIQRLMDEEEKIDLHANKKLKIKTCIDNMERDKEIAEIRMKKYENDSKLRSERIRNFVQTNADKDKEFIKKNDQIIKQARIQKLAEFKEKERRSIEKRIEVRKNQLVSLKNYVNEKVEGKYIYKNIEKNYLTKEEKVLRTECTKRRNYAQPITHDDFNDYYLQSSANQEKIQEKCEKDTNDRLEEWRRRAEMLPKFKYKAQVDDHLNEEDKKLYEKEEMDIKIKENMDKLKQNIVQPFKSRKLMQTRNAKINQLNKNEPILEKNIEKKRVLENKRLEKRKRDRLRKLKVDRKNRRRKIIRIKKHTNGKPRKYKWEPKLNPKEFIIENELPFKKPIHISIAKLNEKEKKGPLLPLSKPVNYLKELRDKRLVTSPNHYRNDQNAWKKIMTNRDDTLFNRIENIKIKTNVLDERIRQKEQYLKFNGGLEKNPEVGSTVSNIIIDSIKAKLAILDGVSNKI